jgi:glutathione synthase/RimK-type ligase-like ATP-grasp enzyme
VEDQILTLQRRLGLIYSAFDLVRTPQGEYVFLETNPFGQWLWIEDLTGLPISKAIADFLAAPLQ